MSQLPSLTGKQLLAALGRLGFEVMRTRGSHHFLKHSDGRSTVVPVHSGESIGRGLMAKVLRDTEVTRDQLKDNL